MWVAVEESVIPKTSSSIKILYRNDYRGKTFLKSVRSSVTWCPIKLVRIPVLLTIFRFTTHFHKSKLLCITFKVPLNNPKLWDTYSIEDLYQKPNDLKHNFEWFILDLKYDRYPNFTKTERYIIPVLKWIFGRFSINE